MKHPDLIFDTHRDVDCPNRFCRVHFFYDFAFEQHTQYPGSWKYHSNTHGWRDIKVHIGPAAWLPRKPTNPQWIDMLRSCPHTQTDLTCNYCFRHSFHPHVWEFS